MAEAFNPRQMWLSDDDVVVVPKDYDPRQTFTKSTDPQGHSCEVRVPIPPHLHAKVKELVMKGTIPGWRSMGDVFRDSLHHRLVQIDDLEDIGAEYAILLRVERGLEALELKRQMRKGYVAALDAVRNDLATAHVEGDVDDVSATLMSAAEIMVDWPTYWAEKMEQVIAPYQS